MIDAGDASEGKPRQHSSTMDSAMFPSDRCPKTLVDTGGILCLQRNK